MTLIERAEASRIKAVSMPGPFAKLWPDAAPRGSRAKDESARVRIDLVRLERSGYIVPTQKRTDFARHFGQIKRPLLAECRRADAQRDRPSLMMVTSALPREGKTFCAINLAISMSFEIDLSVLLVDADVVRPAILDQLGLAPRRGLMDLLLDPTLELDDVVLSTNIPKLSLLPAGSSDALSAELLASEAMERLMASLIAADPKRVVIFDTPPLLATTEAKVLAPRMGQIVMVVAASTTPRHALTQAFAAVEHCKVVASVLNKARYPELPPGYAYEYQD